jgi:hypothetical protein
MGSAGEDGDDLCGEERPDPTVPISGPDLENVDRRTGHAASKDTEADDVAVLSNAEHFLLSCRAPNDVTAMVETLTSGRLPLEPTNDLFGVVTFGDADLVGDGVLVDSVHRPSPLLGREPMVFAVTNGVASRAEHGRRKSSA